MRPASLKTWRATRGQFLWLQLLLGPAMVFSMSPLRAEEEFYVDCRDGDDSHSGTSPSEAWGSLEKINEARFSPGDSILFRRGTRCSGMLSPHGSGFPDKPVTVAAYGLGALPIIDGSGYGAAVRLFNQECWNLKNLEITGGDPYGIYISGDEGTLRHFRISDVVVHNVTGKVDTKRSGLIAVVAGSHGQTFEDVVIDGATCFKTTQWAGIVVDGGATSYWEGTPVRARDVTVRNCVVHDVYGDGIILFRVRNGVIEKNVSWNTGMQHSQDVGTPNAMWTWTCDNCIVQFNEGFFADSPGVDGGVFDIDWGCTNNIIQYNYAHDSQGYCASVFGAGGKTTTNSIVRYNVCVNNGRSPRLAERQGEMFLSTWDGGALDGVTIHNNTIYWNPPSDTPALLNQAEFLGERPNSFQNNLIYSTVPTLVESNSSLALDHNLYWYTGTGLPKWLYGGRETVGFGKYREVAGQDQNGVFADPKLIEPRMAGSDMVMSAFKLSAESPALDAGKDLGEMGCHDFFGAPVPENSAPDIGAAEGIGDQSRRPAKAAPDFELVGVQGDSYRLSEFRDRWILLSFLTLNSEVQRDLARTQAVFLRSMLYQFGEKGLQILVVLGAAQEDDELSHRLMNLSYDWQLQQIILLVDSQSNETAGIYEVETTPTVFLISPDGRVVQRWDSSATAPQLGLTLRWLLGPPSGTPRADLR